MAVARCFRKARGTGGKDQQAGRFGAQVCAQVARKWRTRRRGQGFVQARINLIRHLTRPRLLGIFYQPERQRRQVFGDEEVAQNLFTNNDCLGIDRFQRVRQCSAAELGIDEAHHHPKLGQCVPTAEKRRAVFHRQCADITWAQATGMKDMRQAIGLGIYLGETQALLTVDDEGPLAMALRLFFQAIGQGITICRLDSRTGFSTAIEDGLRLLAWHNPTLVSGQQACVVEIVHPFLR
ncbi:hypothetical protein D3C77_513130 [compost metagenome]